MKKTYKYRHAIESIKYFIQELIFAEDGDKPTLEKIFEISKNFNDLDTLILEYVELTDELESLVDETIKEKVG